MTKILDKGEDKIQQICDKLKLETLEPARKEAEQIVEEARAQAKKIVSDAESQAAALIAEAHETLKKERSVFDTSLRQAMAQCVEALKQTIQRQLFNDQIQVVVDQAAASPEVVSKLIQALIGAIEKEGTAARLEAVIPRVASPQEVNALLGEKILKRLKGESVKLGGFAAGAQVKLEDRKLTLDMSDEVLKELFNNFLREDFRQLLFQ